MKEFKHFTYWVLLMAPVSGLINIYFGLAAQWTFTGGFIYALFVPMFAKWLNNKF